MKKQSSNYMDRVAEDDDSFEPAGKRTPDSRVTYTRIPKSQEEKRITGLARELPVQNGADLESALTNFLEEHPDVVFAQGNIRLGQPVVHALYKNGQEVQYFVMPGSNKQPVVQGKSRNLIRIVMSRISKS